MYQDIIKQRKRDFDATYQWALGEVANIRTGRANPSLVEDIRVDFYGSKMRVKELATITAPEPRVLVIQPWDKGALAVIEKGIRDSNLGLNPITDGASVRLNIPSLTEERRAEFVKLLHQKIEEARIRTRQIREDILKKVQTEVREGKGREDDDRKAKDEVQKIIDNLNKKFDDLIKKKEAELMNA